MADAHRRIQLQEIDDLRYLVANVDRIANTHIDQNLPPVQGDDPLRLKVQDLVHAYIAQTFAYAAPNLEINGHPVSEATLAGILRNHGKEAHDGAEKEVEDYAPQNEKLRIKLAGLHKTADALVLELADLRRTAPAKIVEQKAEAMRRDADKDEADLKAGVARQDRVTYDSLLEPLERQADVEASWNKGVRDLSALKRELGGTAARMSEAKRAADFVLQSK